MVDIQFTLLLLAMLSYVRSEDIITITGYEGGKAVIDCPTGGLNSNPKYLLKDKDEIIRIDGVKTWIKKGRVTLNEKKDRNIFTVTILELTLEDAGIYWCGINTWGLDYYYTQVNMYVTTGGTTVTASSISVTAHVTTSGQASEVTASESDDATHIPTDPRSSSSGVLVYIGAGLALLMILLVSSLFMLYARKTKGRKSIDTHRLITPSGGCEAIMSTDSTPQVQCHYAEIHAGNSASSSSCATPSTDPSAIYSNVLQPSNQNPDSVEYSSIRFDRDEKSLQYATVRFTEPPAGGDKQGSTKQHERRDDAVIYSIVHK